jgi:predicted trehalose synthase
VVLVVQLGAASIVGLTAIVGCSGGASGPPPPAATASATSPSTASSAAPTSAALCTAVTQFRAAAAAIGNVDAAKVGVDGVKAALGNLQSAGRELATAAGAQFGPDADNLSTALGSLQATLASLTDQTSLSTKFGALAASVGAVEQAAAPIVNSARTGCPA